MEKRFHYIYKITLLCGSKKGYYYFGKRTTRPWQKNPSVIDDGYAGSGTVVKNYFNKYGKILNETYIKEIVEFNESFEINSKREKEIIGDRYETDPLCLNLKEGGFGGVYSIETRKKISDALKGKKKSEEAVEKNRQAQLKLWSDTEHKKKMSDAHKGKKQTEESIDKRVNSWADTIKNMSEDKFDDWHNKIGKAISKPVYQIKDGVIVNRFDSAKIAQDKTGILRSAISGCCKHKYGRSTAGGFSWEYA